MTKTILHRLLNVADHCGDNIAIIHGDKQITYRQLVNSILNISNRLTELDVAKNDRICLFVNNSIEYVILYYAVWKAGCIVVALNIESKVRDISNWLKHSDAKLLIFDDSLSESKRILDNKDSNIKYICVDNIFNNKVTNAVVDSNLPDPEDIASIIYTSGTTGNPKGVTLSHKNLYFNMMSILDYLPITDNDIFINVLPFYYSYGNSVLHTHMMKGACIVLINSMMFPKVVLEAIEKHKATSLSGVPSTFLLLLNRTNMSAYNIESIKYITQAGGAMAPSTTKKLIETLPNSSIYIMYGQTEASARLTYLEPGRIIEKMSSIGKPISGVEVSVINENGEQADIGEIGVLHVRGNNIMKGYWKDPKLTSTVIDENGWLNTGDLVKSDDEGFLYIIGRKSEMIKSGANRISPKEIEEVLLLLPEIHDCAVIGVEDDMLGEVIKAYIVSGDNIDALKVKKHCKDNLANYKIPKYIEFINDLPKTSSGKTKKYLLK